MNKALFSAAAVFLLAYTFALAHEEEDADAALEPTAPPLVEFSREGHLDVSASSRSLAWKATDADQLESLEVQVVMITDGSKEPEVLYRSSDLSGQIKLDDFERGPGLYAILADTRDKDGAESKYGMRFSYAALNPECPTEKAWWAGRDTVDFQSGKADASDDYQALSAQNLLSLSRHASHAVTGVVAKLIACPTKEGSLFTYVVFDDVRPLNQEGESKTPRELILRMPGGMSHGRVEIVTDAPIFREGDRVLLFLNRNPQSHMPIAGGAGGVFLIHSDDTVRTYWGPNVVGVSDDFTIQTDPGYRLNPKHLRHYDPNMQAVVVNPEPVQGINASQDKDAAESVPAISIKEFAELLQEAWRAADRKGRVPARVNFDERPPYNSVPSQKPST